MFLYHELTNRPNAYRNAARPENRRRPAAPVAATNVRETETEYEVHMAVPGRAKEDFKLQVSAENVLTISCDAKEDTNNWAKQEFQLGALNRSFQLSDNIDTVKIAASYDAGILVIRLPKREEAQKAVLDIAVQ